MEVVLIVGLLAAAVGLVSYSAKFGEAFDALPEAQREAIIARATRYPY